MKYLCQNELRNHLHWIYHCIKLFCIQYSQWYRFLYQNQWPLMHHLSLMMYHRYYCCCCCYLHLLQQLLHHFECVVLHLPNNLRTKLISEYNVQNKKKIKKQKKKMEMNLFVENDDSRYIVKCIKGAWIVIGWYVWSVKCVKWSQVSKRDEIN